MKHKERLASFLHLMFCPMNHDGDMLKLGKDTGNCKFMLEEQLKDPWRQKDHLVWLEETDKFLLELGVSDPEIALSLITKIIRLCNELREMKIRYPGIEPYIKNLQMYS